MMLLVFYYQYNKSVAGIIVVCNAQVTDIPTEYKLDLDSAAKQQLHTCWYEPNSPLCPVACTRESRPVCALSICLGLKTFSNPCLLDSHNTVSYTHLDVYKRQSQFLRFL